MSCDSFICSEIPEVSLCLPDSDSTESQTCPIKIEENQADSSSPIRSHSSTQLNHQVSQGSGYHSPECKRCPCCAQQQSNQTSVCPGQADCSASPVKTVHGCSPSHLPSCHNKSQGHWLHESPDGSNHKPAQRHMVTVRSGLSSTINVIVIDIYLVDCKHLNMLITMSVCSVGMMACIGYQGGGMLL